MKVLVIGATGRTGRVAVEELRSRGHEVTAFARRAGTLLEPSVRNFQGDAMHRDDVCRAVRGQDAVLIVLGIRENPLLVRLRGNVGTPLNVRSAGTRNVVEAMQQEGVRRLVVQTTYGIGETKDYLPAKWRILFSLLLKPQIADSEEQERIVRSSSLDWVIVQPVGLTDIEDAHPFLASPAGEARGMTVSRKNVARVLADVIEGSEFVGNCISVSA